MNRLSRFCDGIMETVWLLAIIAVGLYFTLDSVRMFEPDKAALLRSFVLAGLAAWGVKLISDEGTRFESILRPGSVEAFFRIPLVLPVTALVFIYALSTLLSVSPLTSLKGFYGRYQGTYTLFSYLVLFALVAANLRRREQVERLIAVLAAVSFAVDIYAVLQHFHIDFYNWALSSSGRSFSTVGYPIFMAAFLSMALPIFLGRAILAFQSFSQKQPSRNNDLVKAVLYSALSILNLVAIWYSVSRGPLVGLFFGLGFFALVFLAAWRLKRLFYGFLVLALVGMTFLVILNLPSGPLSDLRDSPLVGPLGHILDIQGGTGRTRVLLWEGASQLVQPHAPLSYPDGTPDRWNIIRPLVGYGPDTLQLVFEDYNKIESFVLETRGAVTDRTHNSFWDALAFYGILGFMAEYGLFLSLFYYALRWMGLIPGPFERKLYWGLVLSGGLVGFLIALAFGPALLGLGLPLGLLLGPSGALLYHLLRSKPPEQNRPAPWQMVTLASIFSLIVVHYVEPLFGFPVTSTRTLFWVFSALSFVVGYVMPPEEELAQKDVPARKQELLQVGINALLGIAVMAMLGPGFIYNSRHAADAADILVNALTMVALPSLGVSYAILWMLLGTMLVTILLLQVENDRRQGQTISLPGLVFTLGIVLFASLLIWLLRASLLAAIARPAPALEIFIANAITPLSVHSIVLLVILLLLAFIFSADTKLQPVPVSPLAITGGIVLLITAISLSVFLNIRPVQADILALHAQNELAAGRYGNSMAIYTKVLDFAPNEDIYWSESTDAIVTLADSHSDSAQQERLYQAANENLQKALDLNPLSVFHSVSLARFYRAWGERTQDATIQKVRFTQSNSYYASALTGRLSRVDWWLEWAELRLREGDLKDARAKIDTVIKTDGTYGPAYGFSGKLYSLQAETEPAPATRADLLNRAAQDFETQIKLIEKRGDNPFSAWLNLGDVYMLQEQYEQARQAYVQAAELGLGGDQWQVYQKLAELSGKLNDTASQREYLKQAIAVAPASKIPALQAVLDSLNP